MVVSNIDLDIENFDVCAWLDDRNIPYLFGPGKNVGADWIELACVFPVCGDPSAHLGISLKTKLYHCWRCGNKGGVIRLIQIIDKCSYRQATQTLEEFQEQRISIRSQESIPFRPGKKRDLLSGFTKNIPELFKDYLRSREFDPDTVINRYNLFAPSPYNIGKWRFRLIIPVYLNNRVVNITSRDVTGKASLKTLHLANTQAIIPIKQLLYESHGLMPVVRQVLIVEGPVDVWRIGSNTVATLGIEVSPQQILCLKQLCHEKKIKKVFVMFDSDDLAKKRAERLANNTAHFCETEVLFLNEGDPGDMSKDDVRELRREIFNET